MSVDILGTSCDQCRSMVQYSFTSTETRRLVRTDSPGQPPRLSHSSLTINNAGEVFEWFYSHVLECIAGSDEGCAQQFPMHRRNRRSSDIQGTALGKCLQAWSCTYRSMPAECRVGTLLLGVQ